VIQGGQSLEGLAQGVDTDGALLVDVEGDRRRILSGEVSVRQVR
jgi:biotin-(acetyl-CoA carboxylase) ligase